MTLSPATPELPVADVRAAQEAYRDQFGLEINWFHEGANMGAVSHGECAVFFKQTDGPITPVNLWIFARDVDAAHADMTAKGAQIIGPLADMPWGLRQFTVQDLNGHTLNVFHDL